jgi:threonine dehydratase
MLVHPNIPTMEAERSDVQAAAQAIGQQLLMLDVSSVRDIETAFAIFVERGAGALLVGSGGFLNSHRERIVALAARHALPAMFAQREAAVAGGLMSYGASITDAYRQVGLYAARILKGDEAKERAVALAAERGLRYASSFHRDLVVGVATYAHELFTAAGDLDTVYVPIGLGSGICGVIGTRDLLGLSTRIVGVVSDSANAYRLSVEAGRVISTNSALTFADGLAVRVPDPAALEIIRRGAERIVEVSDDEIAEAMRIMFSATHSCAEGAGAAALAALIKERDRLQGRRAAVIMTGQNIDRSAMETVLAGGTPRVG